MLFVTGPLYSGKRTFSQKFGGRQICDVQNLAANATDLEKLADELAAYDVVIATEIGGGIVPIDPAERAAREVLFFDGVPACTSAGARSAALPTISTIPNAPCAAMSTPPGTSCKII